MTLTSPILSRSSVTGREGSGPRSMGREERMGLMVRASLACAPVECCYILLYIDLFQDLDGIEASILSGPKSSVPRLDGAVSGSTVSDAEGEYDVESGTEEVFATGEEEQAVGKGNENASDVDDEEWGGIQDDDDSEHVNDSSELADHVSQGPNPTPIPPSIPIPAGRYVPPHLRNRAQVEDAAQSEAQLKLTRQLKGLLNRLSEQNIASIVDGVEEIYRAHRRHDVTSTLTTLIVDGISSHSMLLDSYVVLHAAFVSALHKLVGIEFAAYFVQTSVGSYERHFAEVENGLSTPQAMSEAKPEGDGGNESLGKEASNLIVLLSELYNFQVISCVLVYDIIRGLLVGEINEFKIELLLKITRNSGQQLRQDDPTALKSIIQIVHSKLPSQANAMSSRARFMVETLTNLKNNKIKKNAGSTAGAETVDRLKKFLSGLSKKRHVLSHEPLRVSLDDLHNAESKGKWWLVGAAWGGDPLVERQEAQREASSNTIVDTEAISENGLLKLARKQGMNTEIRRGIFVVLMSSEDYVDACERLSQLKLTEVQQREIIRVILHCCGNEKTYNPYYTLVGQQLCRTSHSHKITLQFCLWDFLRDLGETNVGGAEVIKSLGEEAGFDVKNVSSTRLRNVARAYGWWIAKDCCTLAILKPIDFTVLKQQSHAFLKEFLTQVFISTQASTPLLSADPSAFPTTRNRGALEEVFIKATRVQNLAVGLIYFLGEMFRGKDTSDNNGFVRWANQVARDTLRTGMDVIAGL
ncbi:ARM repeat-containing protein [Daedalea quercina L-15889]|uniref:ARM repeat-containing protein n=1 Tax=Daedalea quercina L-15889 TaxID=1314783 RepID=A0A165TN69_9APHY|nr:ARM repeat-containing protein [Daedalea quercina L-15889]